jgi:peptide/nickel transport system permease protein
MFRYIVKRVLLSLITLWLLTTIVFLMAWALPSDPARAILGHTAPEASVIAFREKFGLNDGFFQQYGRLLKGLVTFNFGLSWGTKRPVWGVLSSALMRTAKLAALAMLITAPLSIFAGLLAAKFRDRRLDRGIVLTGLATSSIPEFVTGTLLAVVFGVELGWFKAVAIIPAGTPPLEPLQYLILPAMALAIVYFGYIARMMRAGTIQAMDSDYVRTASMKGLSSSQVMRKHVLRNAIAPTITVMSIQIGYLVSGIVAVEVVFNYPGFSQVLLIAVKQKDLPVLTVAVLISALVYMVATLAADLTIAWLNPRIRLEMGGA